jgi:phosphatidylinositol alpha-mannosyltransferase
VVRIALVHPYSWPAVRRGGERYVHDLQRWLTGRGHEVTLVTGGGPAAAPGQVRLPSREPALDTFGASVLPHLLRHRYDVVHAMVPSAALAATAALQPAVYTVLGHPSAANPPRPAWRRQLLVRAVRSVREPQALSASAAAAAQELTGRRPGVLSPGVFTAEFPTRQGLPVGPPTLLFNGFASDPRKRLSLLLEALPTVLARHPDLRLRLGGGGDPQPALDALAPAVRREVEPVLEELGPGRLEDVPSRYREATVSVLPSVDEAFGLVLVESLASGTPVVCSRSGGMPEIVADPAVGQVVAPDDADALARGVCDALQLAADPATAARCAAHASRWDWDNVGPLHESAYARARA